MADRIDQAGGRSRDLPTFYYRKHFLELHEFVSAHYGHVLSETQVRYIREFRRLEHPAQCLYARLVNRKGRVFAANKLRYPEIGSLEAPLAELRQSGWVDRPTPEFFDEVLACLTKAELFDRLNPLLPGLGRGLRKGDLVELALAECDPSEFMAGAARDGLLVQRRADWVSFLLFLYFGEFRDGLSRFTMRDMGLVRACPSRDKYEPRFADRQEAEESFYFAARLSRHGRGDPRAKECLFNEVKEWPEPVFERAADLRDRLAAAMGRDLERRGRAVDAMEVYSRGDSPACTERMIRLLLAAGDKNRAHALLETCLESPRSDEEWLFARDLFRQKFGGRRTSASTDALRGAETIELDEAYSRSPEQAAMAYFVRLGQRAYRSENALWRSLFGLLFWDEIFSGGSGHLHSPFETLPPALGDGTFYGAHRETIEEKLSGLDDPAATRKRLLQACARHHGSRNGIFRWRRSTAETVLALTDHGDPRAIATMLRHLCRDYRQHRYGFPDLLLVDDEGVRFVEIKAEGDQLRRNQLLRLEQLRGAGFRADVVRIRWMLDPRQVYVVVDVETTGGPGDQHRITEIAAVKVRGDRIVDRYQSLVNPQRPIPSRIMRLTGITDSMVSGAPRFADIADVVSEFLSDAIFVAHNVSFDYGFVSREFARLGQRFRQARLCTCASMRRLYPGLPSYSLGALCREFDIPLRQHHRALCDAEAAAQLLLIVNEKRLEVLGQGRASAAGVSPAGAS